MNESNEIVHVPVPRQYLDVVYRSIADAMKSDSGNYSDERFKDVGAINQQLSANVWTESEVQRLKKVISNPTPRALLDLTTADVNEVFTFTDVYERAGRTHAQARADLAGFTQKLRKQFDKEKWPVQVEVTTSGLLAYRCIDEDFARWWQDAED
jgi:hypothetical protein